MGACTTGSRSPARRSLEQPPADISEFQTYPQKQLKQLEFEGNLENVKISQFKIQDSFGLVFQIQDVLLFKCPITEVKNEKIKWKVSENFRFTSNNYQIRKKQLSITLIDEKQKPLYSMMLNLFKIMTGPFHNDFKIKIDCVQKGRIIFDLKISQVVEFILESTESEIQFNTEYPGQKFNYTLEAYNNSTGREKKRSFKTIPSYSKQVPIMMKHSFRALSIEQQIKSPTFKLKKKVSNLIKVQTTSKIKWSINDKEQMPALRLKIKVQHINSSILQFKLYRFYSGKKLSEFGENLITLSELLQSQPIQTTKNNDDVKETRFIRLQKKLWQNGSNIGTCKLLFKMENSTFIKQMNSFTNTEDGIINMAYFQFYASDQKKKKSCTEKLQQMYEEIIKMIAKRSREVSSFMKLREISNHISSKLQLMYEYLVQNLKDSYVYNCKKMRKQQILLLNILKMLGSLIEDSDMIIGDNCWKICIQVLKRGQMTLKNIGFTEEEVQLIIKDQKNENIKNKIQIGIQYQNVIYNLLKKALQTDVLLHDDSKIQHSEIFKVYCYFRVPLFRQKLLQTIVSEKEKFLYDKQVCQSQKFEENLKTGENIFNWSQNFFDFLKVEKKSQDYDSKLSSFFQSCSWFTKIGQRNILFFNFIRYLISKAESSKKRHILPRWQYFPGYNKIVRTYLFAFKNKYGNSYSTSLQLSILALLQNEKLFPPILKVLYENTNVYEKTSVIKLLKALSAFLDQMIKHKKINNHFPYNYFMKGIIMILEVDCSISISQALSLIYNFYEHFEQKFRFQLVLYLTGKKFWQFFYHWSQTVRKVYHHLLILKISQDPQFSQNSQIIERIKTCETLINNTQQAYEKIKKSQKHLSILRNDKNFYLKMKEKLRLKKQNKENNKSLSMKDLTYDYLSVPRGQHSVKLSGLFLKEGESMKNDENLFKAKSCNFDSQQILDLTEVKLKLVKKLSYVDHKHKLQCFEEDQLFIQEMNDKAKHYILISTNQFKEMLEELQGQFQETKKLPTPNFGLQINIDEKQIRPPDFQLNFID